MNASRSKANSVDSLGWQPHQSGGQVAPLAATTQRQVQLVICLGVGELSHCGLVSISVSASAKLLTGSSGSRPCHCRCHTMYQPRKRDTCDLAAAQLRARRDGGTNAGIQPTGRLRSSSEQALNAGKDESGTPAKSELNPKSSAPRPTTLLLNCF